MFCGLISFGDLFHFFLWRLTCPFFCSMGIFICRCFVVLLVVAGLLWMIKLRIEVFRRNQRRYDEIEQMASRPFASVRLELTSPRANLVSVLVVLPFCFC